MTFSVVKLLYFSSDSLVMFILRKVNDDDKYAQPTHDYYVSINLLMNYKGVVGRYKLIVYYGNYL